MARIVSGDEMVQYQMNSGGREFGTGKGAFDGVMAYSRMLAQTGMIDELVIASIDGRDGHVYRKEVLLGVN